MRRVRMPSGAVFIKKEQEERSPEQRAAQLAAAV
jgi:hypothetical protein